MNQNDPFDLNALLGKAKASEDKEACRTIDRNSLFRIAVCVRLVSPTLPSFFVEVVIHLSPAAGDADLDSLEKGFACLKTLQANGYSVTTQDGDSVSCEKTASPEGMAEEYAAVKAIMERRFKT